jgi:hypothetical protein
VLGALAFTVLHRAPDQVPGHAFAIPSGDDRVVAEVMNGSGRQGLARVATRMLRREGIDVVLLGNADSVVGATRILVRRGERSRGDAVRAALGTGIVTARPDTLRRVDVTVVLGRDFRPHEPMHP